MNDTFIDGTIFGIIDNAVLIVGAFTGLEVEKHLPFKTVGIGAVVGAGFGNAFSDLLGGLAVDPIFGFGTFIGCVIGLALIPAFGIYQDRRAAK
jgi:hypothetical protein